jgi:thiosulfate dehydrogenase (quinone) large subunit
MAVALKRRFVDLPDLPFSRAVTSGVIWAWLWLAARLYLGVLWVIAGWEKFENPAWTQTGLALKAYWERAIVIPKPPARAPIVYDWYRSFLEMLLEGGHHTWFAKFVVFGEIAVGVALIVGFAVGVSAFFGALMNMSFMLAGSASANPVMLLVAIALIMCWKNSGYIGLDRWVLPWVVRKVRAVLSLGRGACTDHPGIPAAT